MGMGRGGAGGKCPQLGSLDPPVEEGREGEKAPTGLQTIRRRTNWATPSKVARY